MLSSHFPDLIGFIILILILMLSAHVCLAEEPVVWDFESEPIAWQPRAETIKLSLQKGEGATENSVASLRIYGKIDTGWNYAASDKHPMQAGQFYRLSAWVRVNRLGADTPMPFLKCEFVPSDPSKSLGRVETDRYESLKMGKWQHLTVEFRAPEGVKECWIALEKGGSTPMEIDANIDDVILKSIEKLSVFDKYLLEPIPKPLDKVRGVHPRIYLDSQRIKELRKAIKTTHSQLWKEVLSRADSAVKHGAPAYVEDDRQSGDEQLWQREVGNTMPYLAMAYVLTDDKRYLDSAREWALASCGYKTWGLGSIDGMDLATGHQLFGLGIIYDWCYDGLGEEARKTIRDTLVKRTSNMFEAAATGKAWWRRSYLQNHLWVNICGMSIAGFALFDEVDDAVRWIGLPLDKFQQTMEALGSDGASHEGVGYWQYGVEYMMKFMYVARELLNVNMYNNNWWRNTAAYPQYLTLPRNGWTRRSNIVDIADCPRGNWYGPEYLLRGLAREYRDGYAQWLGQQIDEADVDAASARWLNLVWFDASLEAKPPKDRPTLRHFDDMEIVSARSDWSGDESLVVFKCGPYIGHEAVQKFDYDPGGGHVHPDANHFLVFGNGEWLIRDDGYLPKWTSQHNTLLINGKGQLGEGKMWFQGTEQLKLKAHPRVTQAVSTPKMDHITGDAAEAYPRDIGLQRYVRHLLFLKPDVLIVVDDVEMENASDLELRFHPEHRKAERDGDTFIIPGEKAVLRLELLTGEGVDAAAEDISMEGRHGGGNSSMYTVRMNTKQSRWRNAVALSWSKAGNKPVEVKLHEDGSIWKFAVGDRIVDFDWETGKARIR